MEAAIAEPQVAEVEAPEQPEIKGRGKPEYTLRRVGQELPEPPKAGRSKLYFDLLTAVVADEEGHGEWYEVAVFSTVTGAGDAVKAIEAGDREIPRGQWEFEARREWDAERDQRVSKLYVRYLGEL